MAGGEIQIQNTKNGVTPESFSAEKLQVEK